MPTDCEPWRKREGYCALLTHPNHVNPCVPLSPPPASGDTLVLASPITLKIPMLIFLVVVHVIICLFLIGVVLLQQGKSADLAGAFGGQGSQTAFGPRGAANLLTKLTTWGAVLFMVVSISLTVMLSRSCSDKSVLAGTPTQQSAPKK